MPPRTMEYCKLCDKQFCSYAEYFRHKLETPEHITCDVCSADFHDLKALKSHRDRLHAIEQDLLCTACRRHFTRAGGLMNHIERGDCSKYRLEDLTKLRQKKQDMGLALEVRAREGSERGRPSPSPLTTTFPTSVKGDGWDCTEPASDSEDILPAVAGVRDHMPADHGFAPLLQSLKPTASIVQQFEQPVEKENKPPLKITFMEDDLIGNYDAGSAEINADWYAPLKKSVNVKEPQVQGLKLGKEVAQPKSWGLVDIMDKSVPAWTCEKPDTSKAFTPLTEKFASVQITPAEPTEADLYNPDKKSFNPEVYFNIFTRQYKCPFKACKKSQKTPQSLLAHLRSPAHRNEALRCRGCLRYFNSITALTQHSESQGTRCKIRETDQYGEAIDNFTAGFVGLDGELPDNTVKYKALDPLSSEAAARKLAEANKKANDAEDARKLEYWDKHDIEKQW